MKPVGEGTARHETQHSKSWVWNPSVFSDVPARGAATAETDVWSNRGKRAAPEGDTKYVHNMTCIILTSDTRVTPVHEA